MAEKETHMARDEEYLLYPLDTGEDPVCLRCGSKMLLAGSEARPEKPTLLTFRCDRCGQSEKFLSDEP
jgi:DNA-directed RNA polymerase subunit RPC12/RpoP